MKCWANPPNSEFFYHKLEPGIAKFFSSIKHEVRRMNSKSIQLWKTILSWPEQRTAPKKTTFVLFVCLFSFFKDRRMRWGSREKRLKVKKETHDKLSSVFEQSDRGQIYLSKIRARVAMKSLVLIVLLVARSSPSRDPESRNSSGGGVDSKNIQWNLRKTVAKQHY